jgi:hypothetical protein
MFDTPGQPVSEVAIGEDVIERHGPPLVSYAKDTSPPPSDGAS